LKRLIYYYSLRNGEFENLEELKKKRKEDTRETKIEQKLKEEED